MRERAGQLAQAKAEYEAYLRRYPDRPRGGARPQPPAGARRGFARSQIDRRIRRTADRPLDHGRQHGAHLPVRQRARPSRPAPPPPRPRSMPLWSMAICWCAIAASAMTLPAAWTRAIRKTSSTTAGGQPGSHHRGLRRADGPLARSDRPRRTPVARQPGRHRLFRRAVRRLSDQPEVVGECRGRLSGLHELLVLLDPTEIRHGDGGIQPVPELGIRHVPVRSDGARDTTDRRSIGFQTRYSEPGRTAVMLIDYDMYFKQLNSVTLIGNRQGGAVLGPRVRCRSSPQSVAAAQQRADRPKRAGLCRRWRPSSRSRRSSNWRSTARPPATRSSYRPAARSASAGRS